MQTTLTLLVRVTVALEYQQTGIAPHILLKPRAYLFVCDTLFYLSDPKLSSKNERKMGMLYSSVAPNAELHVRVHM